MKTPHARLICCRRMKSCLHPALEIRNCGTGEFCLKDSSEKKPFSLFADRLLSIQISSLTHIILGLCIRLSPGVGRSSRGWEEKGTSKASLGWLERHWMCCCSLLCISHSWWTKRPHDLCSSVSSPGWECDICMLRLHTLIFVMGASRITWF